MPLLFARQRLLERNPGPPKILIASNPGDGLPLLETFSRNTGRELENAGWKVTGRYGKAELTAKELRDLLPEQDAFLWEGHYRTLIDNFEMPKWTEQLRPMLMALRALVGDALAVDEIVGVAENELKEDATATFRFALEGAGELWVAVRMSDADSPDLYVWARPEVIARVEPMLAALLD